MKLDFDQLIHDLSHGTFGTERYAAKSLRLAVESIFVKLDFKKIRHSALADGLLDVIVGGPPRQVSDIELKPLALLMRMMKRTCQRSCWRWGQSIRLAAAWFVILGVAENVVVEIVRIISKILTYEVTFDVGIQVDVGVGHF